MPAHGGSLTDSITSHGLIACVQAAQQLLQLISTNMRNGDDPELLPPWWHVISYVFTAGTTVIAAHLFPSITERIPISALTASIRQGFEVLQQYQRSRKSAQRCKSELDVLYNKVISSTSRRHSPNAALVTPDLIVPSENTNSTFPATSAYDFKTFELLGEPDMLWLNTALFDSDHNFWL